MNRLFQSAALLLVLSLTGFGRADEPTLALGGMELRLGMSESEVRAAVSPHFRISDVTAGRPHKVLRIEETSPWKEGQPTETGNVTFGPDGLVRAVKSWPKRTSVAADLALFDAISRALSEAGALSGQEVLVSFAVVQRAPVHVEQLKFSLGAKAVVLEKHTVKGLTWVSVLEVIEAPASAPVPKPETPANGPS